MQSTYLQMIGIIPALLVAGIFFYIIRAWRHGTFWSNNIASALGGAVIGALLVILVALFLLSTLEGTESILALWVAMFGIPIFAILGAAIFVAIGATKRKNAPVITQESSLTLPPSIDSASDMIISSEKLTLKNRIKDEPIIAILTIVIGAVILWLGGILAAIIAGAIFYYFFGTKKK